MVTKQDEVRDLAKVLDESMSLADAVDLTFTGWQPSAGDKLVGTVLYVGETDGGHPEFQTEDEPGYPIVGVVTDDGEPVNLHCFHTVLRNAVKAWDPQRGDRIAVKYVGRATEGGKLGDGYEAYNVIVQRRAS